jgi:hypothetical protein
MADQSNSPCALLSAANEIEAAGIVTALAEYGIEASVTGEYTYGLPLSTPDIVQILVRQCDLERAKQALDEIRKDQSDIDWSKIDVGEPTD